MSEIRRTGKKILIVGSYGILGESIQQQFNDCETYNVVSKIKEEDQGNERFIQVDLSKEHDKLTKILGDINPHVIILAMDVKMNDLQVEGNEEEEQKFKEKSDTGRKVVVETTKICSDFAYESDNCFCILLSCNKVFDGLTQKAPFKPNTKPNPISEYGKIRYEAELAFKKSGHTGAILRTSDIYDDNIHSPKETSFLFDIVRAIKSGERVILNDFIPIYPTYAEDVAKICREFAERRWKHCGFTGKWHFSFLPEENKKKNDDQIEKYTQYGIAMDLGKILDLPTKHIEKMEKNDKDQVDLKLNCTALHMMGVIRPSPFWPTIKNINENYE